MKKRYVVLVLCSSLFLFGCGGTDTESSNNTSLALPTESKNKVESTKESIPSESELPDNNSWDYVADTYPFVSYDDVKAGKYNKQYVILSATIENTDYIDSIKWLKCDVWFSHNDSYICDDITFKCDDLQGYSPTELKSGDNVDICFFIEGDSSFGFTIKAYNLNESQLTLEDIYSSFSENSALWSIEFDYCGVVKNDVTKNWRYSKVYTDFDALDYALYYYKRYFQSDNEIHAIINYSNNTTIRIQKTLEMLDVSVLSHIEEEEKDAKKLFCGDLIQDYLISIESGELVNIEE